MGKCASSRAVESPKACGPYGAVTANRAEADIRGAPQQAASAAAIRGEPRQTASAAHFVEAVEGESIPWVRHVASAILPVVARGGDEGESLKWLNVMFGTLWPKLNEAVRELAYKKLEPVMNECLPGCLEGRFRIVRIELGGTAPKLGPIQVSETPQGLQCVIGIDFDSSVDIAVSLGVKIGIHSLKFSGDLVIEMGPLIGELPVVGGLKLYFLDPPATHYNFTGVARVAELPVIKHLLRSTVDRLIAAAMVMPNVFAVPLILDKTSASKSTYGADPVGLLRVTALRAENLQGADWNITRPSTSDPYLRLKFSDQEWRSSTVMRTLDPVWTDSDVFDMVVYDMKQSLSVEVYDQDWMSSDDYLGCIKPLMVSNALASSESRLPLFRKAIGLRDGLSLTEGPDQGALWMRFELLRLRSGMLSITGYVLRAEFDELRVPSTSSSAVRMLVKIGDKVGHSQFKKTRKGILDAAVEAVDATLRDVVQRSGAAGLDVATIVTTTGLEASVVEELLRTGSSNKSAEVGGDRVVSLLNFNRAVHVPISSVLVDSGKVELVAENRKKAVLGTATMDLLDVGAGQGLRWPDGDETASLELLPPDGRGPPLLLHLRLSLLGMQHASDSALALAPRPPAI
mmetsp:Transcript_83826/g.233843  ORF Transcript_83826/g.233843 Transcript_83826/m.233843 type:complete len:629 (-) Transcript_83826:81-1967(-)